VTITPDPGSSALDSDYTFVYLNSQNFLDLSRTSTDPAQSVFLAANLPPRSAASPYQLTVTAEGRTLAPLRFAIQADVATYVLVKVED
jgi:hypothetical protein